MYFTKWLFNDLLNFSFCKYISSHPTSICSKLVLLPGALLFTLNVFEQILAGWDPMYETLDVPGDCVDFAFKTCLCTCYKKLIPIEKTWAGYISAMSQWFKRCSKWRNSSPAYSFLYRIPQFQVVTRSTSQTWQLYSIHGRMVDDF